MNGLALSPHESNAGARFRETLRQELVRRIELNPHYSLRALARQLEIEPSRLSKMLRGERPIRDEWVERFGLRLGWDYGKVAALREPPPRAKAASRERAQISLDVFSVIEDWRHYAILELLRVEDFAPRPAWVARRLGTNAALVRDCVARLVRVGLLEVAPDGSWRDLSGTVTTDGLGENATSAAHRRFQAGVLSRSRAALDAVSAELRGHSSVMTATHASRIPEAKRRIRAFRRSLTDFLEAAPTKNTVYEMSLSLYPLESPPAQKKVKK